MAIQDGHDREPPPPCHPFSATYYIIPFLGEILERATRVLTDEEKALLNKDFVGKNGQRRKLEVSVTPSSYLYVVAELIVRSLSWDVKN